MMLSTERNGFALPAAVLAMVVIGALVTGGFYAASQEGRISMSSDHGADALRVAEQGMAEAVGSVFRQELEELPGNGMLQRSGEVSTGRRAGRYEAEIRRLGESDTYLVSSTGIISRGTQEYQRQTALLVRIRRLAITPRASLVILGPLTVTGNSEVDGHDREPDGWADCPDPEDASGIVTSDESTVNQGGSSDIDGVPAIEEDDSLGPDDFLQFGDINYDQLAAMADKRYYGNTTITGAAPVASDGVCARQILNNWGSPVDQTHPCWDYFPIIHQQGGPGTRLKLASNSIGQGILLVDGDLELQGGSTFYGIVIVRGTLLTTGTGGHINGTALVFSGGELLDNSFSGGNSTLQFSSCAAHRAALFSENFRYAHPIGERSWIDLTSAGVGN
jgi:hypothetical protein